MAGLAELTAPADGHVWSFAVPDWVERLKSGTSLVPDLPLDAKEAARAVTVFNNLRLPDVPGQPLLKDAAGEWVRDIVRALFGSLGVDGVRRVPEIFTLVPKKNSKTTNGAAIMITALLFNQRPRAEFLLIGPTQEIADLAFKQAAGMIEADRDGYLQKRFQIREHTKEIIDLRNKAFLKIKTFDMKVMTGAKPVGVLIDELHILGSMAQARRVIGQIRGGLMANPESFLIIITTQSDEPPAGVFKEELQYARAIRDGRIKGQMLPMLYEFPEEMQTSKVWLDQNNWPMVLPNLGLSIQLDRLVTEFNKAKDKSEEELRRWASQHLNVEIGLGLHSDRWRGADYWLLAQDPGLTLDELIERSEVCTMGIDGGGLDDLLGLTVLGRDKESKNWLSWSRAWCQRDVLELRKEIAPRLEDFEKEGTLTICDDPTEDVMGVADIAEQLFEAGMLPEKYAIGLDPVGIAALLTEMAGRGLDNEMFSAIGQGYRLNGAIKGAERKLKDGTLRHDGSLLMNWCVGNCKTELSGSAVVITKKQSGTAKIDPVISLFNAFQLMARNPEAAGGPSVYEKRGALII